MCGVVPKGRSVGRIAGEGLSGLDVTEVQGEAGRADGAPPDRAVTRGGTGPDPVVMPAGTMTPPAGGSSTVAKPVQVAFVAHAGRKIALRAVGGVSPPGLPTSLSPGERLGDLAFGDLATAFRGVVEFDLEGGRATVAESAPGGAPARIAFAVDRRGIVALRALDGHPWREDIPAGRAVFGLPAEALLQAGRGVLELDAASLEARLSGGRDDGGAPNAPVAVQDASDATEARPARRSRSATVVATGPATPGDTAEESPPPRRLGAVIAAALILAVAVGGVAWWQLARDALPATPAPEAATGRKAAAPPGPASATTVPAPEPATAPAESAVAPQTAPAPAATDPLERLGSLAAAAPDPDLRAALDGIAADLRAERLARAGERGRAAAAAVTAGAQLARTYRRDAADVRRLEAALGVCGEEGPAAADCRGRFGAAVGRAAEARELTLDAYVRLLGEVAAAYPPELLTPVVGVADGDPDGLVARFVAQVERRRGIGTDGARDEVARELADDRPQGPPAPPAGRVEP